MRQPEFIETRRLSLRPVLESDAPEIFDYAGGARTTHFMTFARHRKLAESVAFARRCAACWSAGSAFPWTIVRKSHNDLAGVIELRLAPPKADFGYILREAFWSAGFASEAATAIVDWVLAQPAIHRVWATCHPDNLASARVLTKAGLRAGRGGRAEPVLRAHSNPRPRMSCNLVEEPTFREPPYPGSRPIYSQSANRRRRSIRTASTVDVMFAPGSVHSRPKRAGRVRRWTELVHRLIR